MAVRVGHTGRLTVDLDEAEQARKVVTAKLGRVDCDVRLAVNETRLALAGRRGWSRRIRIRSLLSLFRLAVALRARRVADMLKAVDRITVSGDAEIVHAVGYIHELRKLDIRKPQGVGWREWGGRTYDVAVCPRHAGSGGGELRYLSDEVESSVYTCTWELGREMSNAIK